MLIERLSKESGLRMDRLKFFAKTASKRYFVFSVPKATGGYRQIAHPARPLKSVQRWLNSRYFKLLPVHPCAKAYRKGVNIRANAEPHADKRYTLRVDFRDFFPNFTVLHVFQFLKVHQTTLALDDEDVLFVAQLVCRYEGLTIGAPSSPILTNAMMYAFDEAVSNYCSSRQMVYTRYADDVFISTDVPNSLNGAYEFVKSVADGFPYADLRINGKKTAFLSKKYHRGVTGLVITPDGKISIGRQRKREIKSLVHRFLSGDLTVDREEYLKGLLSFASDVEPPFMTSLITKYGDEFMFMLRMRRGHIETSFSRLEGLDPPPESY